MSPACFRMLFTVPGARMDNGDRIIFHSLPSCQKGSCKSYPPAWLGNWSTKLLRCRDPFLDNALGISYRLDITGAVRHATRELRDFDHESLVGIAPVNDQLVLSHRHAPRVGIAELFREPA